ncbi:uL22 family ribosomal protein [Candidatus Vidania fulgoroideorum]
MKRIVCKNIPLSYKKVKYFLSFIKNKSIKKVILFLKSNNKIKISSIFLKLINSIEIKGRFRFLVTKSSFLKRRSFRAKGRSDLILKTRSNIYLEY